MSTTTMVDTSPNELVDAASSDSDSTTPKQRDDDDCGSELGSGSDAEAEEGTAVCYDKVEDVWRCAECLWEVADGRCAGCGKLFEGPAEMLEYDQQLEDEAHLDDSLAFDRPEELKSPPPSPWLCATDYAEALAVSPINHNKISSVRQRLRAAGAATATIDEFGMYWHELDGAVARLSPDDFEFFGPDGFATVKHDDKDSVLSGNPLEPEDAPQGWHVALGAVIDFDDEEAADTIAHQLEIMLDTAQESDFYLPRPGLTPVGERSDFWPITLLHESPGTPAYAYSRVIRPGEVILSVNDELWLRLNSGKFLRVIKPRDAIDTRADTELAEFTGEQAKPIIKRESGASPLPEDEQSEDGDAASDVEVKMEQGAVTPEPSDSSEHGEDEHIKIEADASDASSYN